MKERGATGEFFGCVVAEDGPDHRAFRKGRRLRACWTREGGSRDADSQQLEGLAACDRSKWMMCHG